MKRELRSVSAGEQQRAGGLGLDAAVITGASAGLGAEYARLFAADGHLVALVARREDRLRDLAAELASAYGIEVHLIAQDIGTADGCTKVYESVKRWGRPVGFLVNNAGFGNNGLFWENDLATELGQIRVNIAALTELTHRFLPGMIAAGRGRVLNIASTAGFLPGPYMATYFATKAYVLSFTEALAYELRGTGVTATAHCPGPTATEFASVAGVMGSRLFNKTAQARACALHGYAAMLAGRPVAIHGIHNTLTALSARISPHSVAMAIAAKLNRTPSATSGGRIQERR
jgi:short-subunit dehydrogenase